MNYRDALYTWCESQPGEHEIRFDKATPPTSYAHVTGGTLRRDGAEIATPSEAVLAAAWQEYLLAVATLPPEAAEGAFVLSADKATIDADGVEAATISVDVESGDYGWAVWQAGVLLDSSEASGVINASDDYELALTSSVPGTHTVRWIDASGGVQEIEIEAV